jgi:hypothetical protein
VWYVGNALLDGLNPGSDNPRDRLLFNIYQRRMLLDAMKTKAQLLAAVGNAENAAKVAQEYLEMAIPISAQDKQARLDRLENKLKELENMGPIYARKASIDGGAGRAPVSGSFTGV